MDMMNIRRRVLIGGRKKHKSKNLIPPFDYPNTWGNGYIRGSGEIASDSKYRYSIDLINILPNEDYTLSASNTVWLGIIMYDANMSRVAFWEQSRKSITLKSPENAVSARVYLQATAQDYMFEQASKRSEYEPYS